MRKLAVITLACLTIGAAIAAGSPARAGFIVDASANAGPFMQISGPVVPFPPTNPFSVPLIPANFEGSTFSSIQLVEQSDFPGTGTAGFLQLTGLNIRNLGGFFQSLTLVVTQTGFTEPTSIGAIQVAMSASVVDPPPVITIDLQGCVNSLTGLNPPPGCLGGPQFIAPQLALTGPTANSSINGSFSPVDQPYALTEVITLNMPGDTALATFDATTEVTPPPAVPEPMSAALLASGLAGLALLRRRRKVA